MLEVQSLEHWTTREVFGKALSRTGQAENSPRAKSDRCRSLHTSQAKNAFYIINSSGRGRESKEDYFMTCENYVNFKLVLNFIRKKDCGNVFFFQYK